MEYLMIAAAGSVLAVMSFRLFLRERRRAPLLARLARYAAEETGDRAAGYHPGSLSDPRD
jgi:hypothetical protein